MNVTDNMNMEYEARVMINENQYSSVIDFYLKQGKECHKLVNLNYYYDDDKMTISNNHHVLRLREINEVNHELTLKIKGDNGDIEINRHLTSSEMNELMDQVNISDVEIIERLKEIGVDLANLKLVAKLKTERIEIQEEDYLLVIDKNYYNDKIDYNLEVESTSKNLAVERLKQAIEQFGIEYKKDILASIDASVRTVQKRIKELISNGIKIEAKIVAVELNNKNTAYQNS